MSGPPAPLGKRIRRIPYKSAKAVHHAAPNSDINVTPLVDVCLVLLIIFMVVTPMLGRGRDVQLPQIVEATEHKEGEQVFVSIDDEGAWIEQDIYTQRTEFLDRLRDALQTAQKQATKNNYSGPLLFIKGDRHTDYARVRTVMEWINASDVALQDIALVVELPDVGT